MTARIKANYSPILYSTGACTASTTVKYLYSTSSNNTWITTSDDVDWVGGAEALWTSDGKLELPKRALDVVLPDGSRLILDAKGSFRIEDKDAKVTYQANRLREFNPFVNAGDLVARFIDYARTLPGVARQDVATLPLQLFVHWLILEAAERDGDPAPPDVKPIEKSRLLPGRTVARCLLPTCRRLVRRGFGYCDAAHAQRHFAARS